MKRALVLLTLAMFGAGMIGCHASVDTDTTDNGSSSHYKKTTTYDNGGTKTTETKTTTVNP